MSKTPGQKLRAAAFKTVNRLLDKDNTPHYESIPWNQLSQPMQTMWEDMAKRAGWGTDTANNIAAVHTAKL